MTTIFSSSHLLSDLAKNLIKKLRQALKKLRIRLIDRTTAKICEDCSRLIRPWECRVSVTKSTCVHQSCWEGRQFFREFVRQHDPNSTGPVLLGAPDLRRAAALIEWIVRSFYAEVQRNGKDSPQSEYMRGMFNGAKSMLAELRGRAAKEQVLDEARRRVGKPLPSIIPLAGDGNRYGWDVEAEAGSP